MGNHEGSASLAIDQLSPSATEWITYPPFVRSRLIVLGSLSLCVYSGIGWLSQSFVYGQGHRQRPILEFLALYAGAFVLYVLALRLIVHLQNKACRAALAMTPPLNLRAGLIFFFAILFRTLLLFSNPIQEDDFYRYLWDGKVVASGLNPYSIAPSAVLRRQEGSDAYVQLLESDQAFSLILSRVNHPDVPTIYPPLAQGVFALAALVAPGSLVGLRLIFLTFDLGIWFLIVDLLRRLRLDPTWALVYAWSPLVIKETINSAHYDVVPIFFLVLGAGLLLHGRWLYAHVSLAFAVLGKIYPLLLLPLFAWKTTAAYGWKRALSGVGVVVTLIGAGYMPFLAAGHSLWQGTLTFAEQWQTNSLLFPLLHMLVGDRWIANVLVVGILIALSLALLYRKNLQDDRSFLHGIFTLLGALFLLSPVGDPWYYVWLTPFLCILPLLSWILLSGLLSLYYLSFYFMYHRMAEAFQWVMWLEYAPFYGLLLYEYWSGWAKKRTSRAASFF